MNNTFETWISENIKSQIGKTALVTGANSGIGFFTALAFAKTDADVIDAAALDVELAARLWTTAERATGVTFP